MVKKRGRPKKILFEDKYELIFEQLEKRRGQWFLKAINWISWEDVKQIILTHIYNKWHLWDQKRAIEPWLNRIISNQIKNILRNHYSNFVRPCVSCPFNTSGSIDGINENANSCSWTKTKKQDRHCPLFAKWEKTKKSSYQINTASSIEDIGDVGKKERDFDIDKATEKLNILMKEHLSEKHYKIYKMIHIENLDINKAAEKLGYKSNEKGRKAGYKQIKNFEKMFKVLAKKLIKEHDIA